MSSGEIKQHPQNQQQQVKENPLKNILELVAFLLYSGFLIIKSIYELFLPSTWQPKKDVKGEVVLITGGGGGLGRLLALRMAKLDAKVVLWDVNMQGLEETVNLVKGIGGKAYAYRCDLADKEDVYRVAKKTQQEVGDVTILINNAGVLSGYLLLDTPDHLIKRTFDVNIIAHFWTVKAFLPKMIEKDHGHIVTIASMAGFYGVSKLVDYCASKFAAVGFDESLRVELEVLGVKNVKTTVICPYFIQQTGMFDNVKSRYAPRLKPNEVADRTVEAILREELLVTIPGHLNYLHPLRQMMPWPVNSLLIRSLVPDACPHHQGTPIVQIKKAAEEERMPSKTNGTTTLTSSVSELSHRITATGKDL